MPSQVAAALEYGSAAQRDHLSDRFPASWDRGGSISDQELLNVHSPKESSTKRTARARFRVGSSTTLFEFIDFVRCLAALLASAWSAPSVPPGQGCGR